MGIKNENSSSSECTDESVIVGSSDDPEEGDSRTFMDRYIENMTRLQKEYPLKWGQMP